MASPRLWAEIWRRPGHATFGKVITDVPVISASGTSPVNGVGQGTIVVPKSYDRLDEILKPDPTTPANAVSSLVRVFSESSSTPIYEFIPAVFTGEQNKADPDIEITGPAIDVIWGYARLEPWDWTGIDEEHSNWPDWIWGGRNVLGALESAYKPAITRMYRDVAVTGGTFTIGISFDSGAISDTSNIAWNATGTAIDTELTAELVSMGFADASLTVTGSGSAADPWVIQTVLPEGTYVFSVNSGGLTPSGLVYQDRETIGAVIPAGWTTSFNPVNNISHGPVSVFRASTYVSPDPAAPPCDTTGVAIAFDGDTGSFPGIQKIVAVKPGGRYYASATAYAQGASGTYRFVIRDLYENPIAAEPDFNSGTTLTANTWTTFDNMTAVTIPDDVDRVIVRFASVDGGNPPLTFVTCLELREGMPPTTWGDILTQLWLDASTDHAGRRVWQIGAGATDFLTLGFDAVNDSAGSPWADPEVSITLKRGQSYLRVLGECYKAGYEGRTDIVNVGSGTWELNVYNTGTMGTNHSLISTGPSIQGGRDVTKRDLRRFLPPATDVAVEAAGQMIARARSSTAITALGRIEQYVPNQDLGSMVEAALNAAQARDVNLQRSQSLSYVLTPTTLDPEPFIAYRGADTVYVLDPPDVPVRTARRIKSLGFAWNKTTVEYPVQLESDSYVGIGGISQSVDFLLKEFKAIRERPDETTDPLNYFQTGAGGTPTVVFAPANSSELSKGKADYILTGIQDLDFIQGILDTFDASFAGVGLQVWLTEGTVQQSMAGKTTHGLRFKGPTVLRGMGIFATYIFCDSGTGPAVADLALLHTFGQPATISDLAVTSVGVATNPFDLIRTTASAAIERVYVGDSPRDGLSISGGLTTLTHVWIDSAQRDGMLIDSTQIQAFGVLVDSCFQHGVNLSGSSGGVLVGVDSEGSAVHAFNLDGFYGQLIGCRAVGAAAGIHAENCGDLGIIGCSVVGGGVYGINLEFCEDGMIDGTTVTAASNDWDGSGAGIRLSDCTRVTISSSTNVNECWEDGIKVVDSNNCRVLATVMSNGLSVDNTYDNVRVMTTDFPEDSYYNLIQVFSRPGASLGGDRTRYGVNVETGFCNRVVGCDFGIPGEYASNAFIDTADSTQKRWPNDSYYGDNLIDCGEESPPEQPEGGPDDTTAPAVPVGFAAAPGDTFIRLTWTDNSELDLASYEIYRATAASSGPYTFLVSVVEVSTYTNTGLTNGSSYWYKISAKDTTGNESAQSAFVTAVPAVPAAGVAPAVPTGLSVVVGDTELELDWADNTETDLASYNVYWATASGGPFTLLVNRTVSNYTATGLTNGTPYWFKVSAVDTGANESAQSSSVTATPAADTPPAGLPAIDVIFNSGNLYTEAKVNAEAAGTCFQFTITGGTSSGPRYENAAIPTKAGNQYVFDVGTVLDGNGSVPLAFTGTAIDVEIYDCEWTAYQGQNSSGANNVKGGGGIRCRAGWQIIRPYGHHNKYTALRFDGANCYVEDGDLSYNGEFGFAGTSSGGEVNGTEVHHNGGGVGLDLGGDQGGCKIVHSDGFQFIGINAHDNLGSSTQGGNGLWSDINNINTVYDNCTFTNNAGAGIFHEVSLSFEIKNCDFTNNGRDYATANPGSLWPVSAQIQISNSGGNLGWIHDNTITVTTGTKGFHGITVFNSNHFQWTNGVISNGCLGSRNLLIEDNTINMSGSQWKDAIAITGTLPTSRSGDQFCGQLEITASGSNNRIRNNIETLVDGANESTPYFRAGVRVSASAWAGFGYS